MNFGPINLQSEVQELAERIDTRDERADIAMKISDLTLEQEKTKLELEKGHFRKFNPLTSKG